jgi:predicted transcriptional regulator
MIERAGGRPQPIATPYGYTEKRYRVEVRPQDNSGLGIRAAFTTLPKSSTGGSKTVMTRIEFFCSDESDPGVGTDHIRSLPLAMFRAAVERAAAECFYPSTYKAAIRKGAFSNRLEEVASRYLAMTGSRKAIRIAEELGITPTSVRNYLSQARKLGLVPNGQTKSSLIQAIDSLQQEEEDETLIRQLQHKNARKYSHLVENAI